MKTVTQESRFKIFEDGGHAWLEVDYSAIKELGIKDKISRCSYAKGDKIYLEEDMDMSTFIDAVEKHYPFIWKNNFKYSLEVIYHDDSPIRNYRRYKP